MPRCARKGCGKDFDEESNTPDSCIFHEGVPVSTSPVLNCYHTNFTTIFDKQVFHEGLKSWSCCQDVNKPVLDFDEFMKIPVRTSRKDFVYALDLTAPCDPGLHARIA